MRGLAQRGLQLILIIAEFLLAPRVVLYAGCEAKSKKCCSFCCQLLSNAVSSDVKLVGPAVDRLEMLLETCCILLPGAGWPHQVAWAPWAYWGRFSRERGAFSNESQWYCCDNQLSVVERFLVLSTQRINLSVQVRLVASPDAASKSGSALNPGILKLMKPFMLSVWTFSNYWDPWQGFSTRQNEPNSREFWEISEPLLKSAPLLWRNKYVDNDHTNIFAAEQWRDLYGSTINRFR